MKWNKNKNGLQRELPPFLLNYLTRLNGKLLQFAGFLQKKTMAYSKSRLKGFLVLFCLLFSSISIWVIICSINDKDDSFAVTPIKEVPLIKNKQTDLKPNNETEWKHIEQLKTYLDSLNNNQSGKVIYPPFLLLHPHVKDSFHFLEHQYYEQHYSNNYGK